MPATKPQDIQKTDDREQVFERKEHKRAPRESAGLETLASFYNTLSSGERPMTPPGETLKAAGTLGNQNVLRLIEASGGRREQLVQERTDTEAYNLAVALGGPPTDSASTIFSSE